MCDTFDSITRRLFDPLPSLVRKTEPPPHRLMEIGIAKGTGAKLMIKAAKRAGIKRVEYYGFDLFKISEMSQVKKMLKKTGATVHLFKGDIRETLPRVCKNLPAMDFIYIDVKASSTNQIFAWEHVRSLMHERTVVVLTWMRTMAEIDTVIYDIEVISTRCFHFFPIPSLRAASRRCVVTLKREAH